MILSLSGKFLSFLRDHSPLRCESGQRLLCKEAEFAREECHQNFWRYAKESPFQKTTKTTLLCNAQISIKLKTYTGEAMLVLGKVNVTMEYGQHTK